MEPTRTLGYLAIVVVSVIAIVLAVQGKQGE